MSFIDKLRDALGLGAASPNTPPQSDEMREAMDMARLARRNEDYDRALASLDRAMNIADEDKDTHSVTVIALHQADVLIEKRQFEEAEQLLQTVLQTAEAVNQSGFMSYAMSSLGVLQTRRGDWNEARETFERAREIGKEANNPGAEGRAMGHLADIYMHENNASYAVHLLQECLPKLNEAGDLELSSYFVGRLGEAMIITGQETEGYQLLDRGLRLGEQLRDNQMIRRWSVAIGDVAYNRHNYQEAYMFYKRALPLFSADPTPDYIRTLTRTSRTCLNTAQPEESLVYAEQAVRVTETQDDEALTAEARGALGIALRTNRRSAEAVEHLRAAVDATTETSAASIELLRQLGAALAATDANAAEATYQRAIEQAKAAELTKTQADVQRDMGLLYANQRKLAEAVSMWDAALSIFEVENDHDQVARLYSDIAGARKQLGQGQRAIRDYEQALIALNNVDDIATRGLVLSNAGNAYADQGDTDSAESFFREAIDIAQKIGDKAAESTRLGNYGWFLLSTGNPRKGVEKLTSALEISAAAPDMKLAAAVQTDNLGLAYDALSQYRTALDYHEKAQALLAELNNAPARWRVMFMVNTAKTRLSLGNVDEALPQFNEALEAARSTGDYEVVAAALVGKGRVTLAKKQAAEAESHITEAVQIARKVDMRRLLAEALIVYSEQQAAIGNDDRARALWEDAKRYFRMVGSPQAKQTPFWLGTNPPG